MRLIAIGLALLAGGCASHLPPPSAAAAASPYLLIFAGDRHAALFLPSAGR